MHTRQAVAVPVLALLAVACSAGAAPGPAGTVSGSPSASPSGLAQATSSPVASPSAAAGSVPPSVAPGLTPRPTSGPSAASTPAATGVLAKPTGVTFSESIACILGEDPDGGCVSPDASDDPESTAPDIEVTHTVTWRTPRTEGAEIRVYGVVECISMPASPKPGSSGPCLAEHTLLPDSTRVLLATAPASAGKVSWSWRQQTPGCDIWYPVGKAPDGRDYYAVVVAAYSASGRSIFAIATTAEWASPSSEPGDQPC